MSLNTREAKLGIAVGKKGVGKTYKTLETISNYVRGLPQRGIKGRSVLILDVNNEYGDVKNDHGNPLFPHIETISLEHIKLLPKLKTPEVRRIAPYNKDGSPMGIVETQQALEVCLRDFKNGMLVIEDITKFVSDTLPSDLVGRICTQRHVSVDILTHFQSIGKAANPKLWANANYIRFHKCDDTVLRHQTKFGEDVTGLKIIETMVNQQYKNGNKRFTCFYDRDYGVAKGEFSQQQFQEAIISYLQSNGKIVTSEANKVHITGKLAGQKIHKDFASAGTFLISEYMNLYYGNADKVNSKRQIIKRS